VARDELLATDLAAHQRHLGPLDGTRETLGTLLLRQQHWRLAIRAARIRPHVTTVRVAAAGKTLLRPCRQRVVEEVPMPSFAPRFAREHRWYVVALLVACGLSPGVAGKAYALGQSVRRRMTQAPRDERVEWGAMIDSATGALIGSLLEGERKGVNLGPHIAALQRKP
jgi:hypothetical protein